MLVNKSGQNTHLYIVKNVVDRYSQARNTEEILTRLAIPLIDF